MSFLSFLFGDNEKPPPDPVWQRQSNQRFHRLIAMKPGRPRLAGLGGVFVVFHRGMQPGWVYFGAARDLGAAVERLQDHRELSRFESRGGLFFTWSFIKPEKRDGVVAYLRATAAPELIDPDLDRDFGCKPAGAKPVPVQFPG